MGGAMSNNDDKKSIIPEDAVVAELGMIDLRMESIVPPGLEASTLAGARVPIVWSIGVFTIGGYVDIESPVENSSAHIAVFAGPAPVATCNLNRDRVHCRTSDLVYMTKAFYFRFDMEFGGTWGRSILAEFCQKDLWAKEFKCSQWHRILRW
jgi:hypothetical protein